MNDKINERPSLALRVRLARDKLRMSQATLAKLLGFPGYKTVAKLEKKHNVCSEHQAIAERWLATVEDPNESAQTDKPLYVRLHECRLSRQLTVVRTGKLFGLSHECITAWENGPDRFRGKAIPREWIPLIERWITTGIEPSKEETKLARQQLVVIGAPAFAEYTEETKARFKLGRCADMSWKTFRRLFEREGTLGLKDSTRAGYRCKLDCFERVAKPKKLKSVNERSLTRYAAHLRDFGRTSASINAHLRVLRRALFWAHEQRLIHDRPRVRLLRISKKLPHIVTEQEFQRLLTSAPDHHWSAFFLSALYTGMRLGELLELEWHDVDFANRRILLRAEFNKSRSDTWIPLHPGLIPVLESLGRDSVKVFSLGVTGTTSVCNRVRQIAQQAGVRCKMHDLRRSTASWLAAEGVPLQIVQRILRHSDPSVTAAYYTNVESCLSEAIAKLSTTSIEQAGFRDAGKAVPA